MLTFPVKFQQRSLNLSGSLALPGSTKQSVLRGHAGVCTQRSSDSGGTNTTHSVLTFPTASPPTTDRITPDTLITSVWKQGRCSLNKHAGHMPESQGLKKSCTAAKNTHSSTICTTKAGQHPGLLFHTHLGDLVLIYLRGPEGGSSTLPYDCASALGPTQLYLGDNH